MIAVRDAHAGAPHLSSLAAYSPQETHSSQQPIIVATDGTDASEPGIRAARTLARCLGAPVQLVSVLQPMQSLLPAMEGLPLPSLQDRDNAEQRLERLREQRASIKGAESWTVEIKFGDPATVITRLAKARRARMIIMGRRAHGRVDQLLGDDTVFDVMRLAETPVLVTTGDLPAPPRVLTVAVDFSPLSTYAARTAIELAPEAGLLYLVHVQPRGDGMEKLASHYGRSVEEGFDSMIEALDPHTGARIDAVELQGTPAKELVDFAESSRSELLVVGSYRRGLFRRLAGGAMAARLMRGSPCPVLVVPEGALRDEDASEIEAARASIPGHAMTALLDELTRRNAGRRVMFETDNPAVGAQLLAFDYSFLAAQNDATANRLHIALADTSNEPCVSVNIAMRSPEDVDVRRAIDGSDHVVRLTGGCGQLILTFW